MDQVVSWVLHQGPVVTALAIICYVMWRSNKELKQDQRSDREEIQHLRDELRLLRDQVNKYYDEDRDKMLDVIQQNTEALRAIHAAEIRK